MTDLDLYWLRVFAAPRHAESRAAETLLYIGGYDERCAYFKKEMLVTGIEVPVYESTEAGIRKAAGSFEEWLTASAARARRHYKQRVWSAVLRGPAPFTEEEMAVVQARRRFAWRVVGVTSNGEVMYEIHNGSDRHLSYLSIGIRGRKRELRGGIWLPVSHIGPGQTLVVVKDTYRNLLDPSDVEAFGLPDPEPEDKSRYWEFRGTSGQ